MRLVIISHLPQSKKTKSTILAKSRPVCRLGMQTLIPSANVHASRDSNASTAVSHK